MYKIKSCYERYEYMWNCSVLHKKYSTFFYSITVYKDKLQHCYYIHQVRTSKKITRETIWFKNLFIQHEREKKEIIFHGASRDWIFYVLSSLFLFANFLFPRPLLPSECVITPYLADGVRTMQPFSSSTSRIYLALVFTPFTVPSSDSLRVLCAGRAPPFPPPD